jgi:hypothetical protein
MAKTSLDYAELAGLRIAIKNAKDEAVVFWIRQRIKDLESK